MTTSGKTSGIHTFKARIPEDVELLTSVGLGDERAMALLYDRHSPLVYSVALRVCHDSASAEAIVQDIFMQMWLAPQKFDPASGSLDGSLRSYQGTSQSTFYGETNQANPASSLPVATPSILSVTQKSAC